MHEFLYEIFAMHISRFIDGVFSRMKKRKPIKTSMKNESNRGTKIVRINSNPLFIPHVEQTCAYLINPEKSIYHQILDRRMDEFGRRKNSSENDLRVLIKCTI